MAKYTAKQPFSSAGENGKASNGDYVKDLTGNLAKHYDRDTAKSDDKKIQEIEADKAEVANLGESTAEANENQLTKFIDMKDLKYTNSEAPLDTLDQSESSTEWGQRP